MSINYKYYNNSCFDTGQITASTCTGIEGKTPMGIIRGQ